jgi:hypothetical protein
MAEALATKQAEIKDLKSADLFVLPSVTSTAESILAEAIGFCAQKMGAGSRAAVVHLIQQRDRTACEYYLYGMAKQVAASLGAMDENVQEVHTIDYDATPEDLCFGCGPHNASLIHLLVWTRRKTAAFNSFVEALDRALVQACADTFGRRGLTTLLDVQVVDDADVRQRRGYGAFRAWMHQPPVRIWKR